MIINRCGGGGGLKLKVSARTDFTSAGKENEIGIITSTAIKGYKFSSTEPTDDLVEGLIWIKTGATSATPIPADAKSKVMLYPLLAKQYVNGAWVLIDSSNVRCYQSNAWKTWEKLIYDNGTVYQPLTFTRGDITYTGSYIHVSAITKNTFYTSSLIDVSGYSTLNMTLQPESGGGSTNKVYVGLYSTTTSPYDTVPDVGYTSVTVGTSTDVRTVSYSLTQTGSYYAPGGEFYSGNGSSPWKIYKIWLAP